MNTDTTANFLSWASQTIASTFVVHGRELGKPMNDASALLANDEIRDTLEKLWAESLHDCGATPTMKRHLFYFQKRVLDWSVKHRFPDVEAPATPQLHV